MKIIENVKGLNLANFEKMEVNLNGLIGIQWGNGVGKGYLKNIIIVGLSTRLNYEVKDITKTTPECEELLKSTNDNAQEPKTREEKKGELNRKLEEIFNQKKNKSNKSFIALQLSDGIKDHTVITYPTANIKILERKHFVGIKGSFDIIYNELTNKILYEDYTITEAINEMDLFVASKGISVKKEETSSKSEFIKKSTSYFLGEETSYKHGQNILLGVSDKTLNTINKIVIENALNSVEKKLQGKIKDKEDDECAIEKFEKKQNTLIKNFTNLIETKQTNPLQLEKIIFEIKDKLKDSELNKLIELKNVYEGKVLNLKDTIKDKRKTFLDNIENIKKEDIDLRAKNETYIKKRLRLVSSINSITSLVDNVSDNLDSLDVPFEEMEDKLKTINNEILALEEMNKKNLSKKDQVASINKDIFKNKKSLVSDEEQILLKNKEIINIQKRIDNKEEYFYCSERSNNDLDVIIYIFDLKMKKEFDNINSLLEISKNIKNNPNDFNNIYNETLEKIEEEKESDSLINLIEKLKEEINKLEITKEISIEDNKKLTKLLSEINLEEPVDSQITKKRTQARDLDRQIVSIKSINNPDTIKRSIQELSLTKEREEEINNSFNLEFSKESILFQIKLSKSLRDDLTLILEEVQKNEKIIIDIIADNNLKINENDKQLLLINKDFESIREMKEIDLFFNENKIDIKLDIEDGEYSNLQLIEIEEELTAELLKIQNKRNDFSLLYLEVKDLINELQETDPRYYLEYIETYRNLISLIRAKINKINMTKESSLTGFHKDISYFKIFIDTADSSMRSLIKKNTVNITKLKCSSGEQYHVKDNLYIEEHPQETEFKRLVKEIFHIRDFHEIDDTQVSKLIEDSNIDDLIALRDIVAIFGREEAVFSLETYLRRKTKNFSFKADDASTGNAFVLNVGVRQDLIFQNSFFHMTTFIDEFSKIDMKNINIMFSQDLRRPTVFLQNSYSDFDKIRKYLDLIQESSGEKGKFINHIVWRKGDD